MDKGVRVSLSGEIKNASSLKTWPIFQHQTNAPPTSLQARLQQITRIANQVYIALPSQINIIIHGDATNTSSFDAFMMLRTPEVQTPWCHVIKGDVFLRLSPPPAFHGPSKLAWNLAADAVETDYARVRNFRSELVALGDDKLSDLIRARMESSASKITTSWAEVDNARLSAHWAHSLTNPMPNEGSVALLLTNVTTRWANASQARLTASLQTPASSMPIQPEWGFWNALAPYVLGLQADLQNVTAGDFQSPRVDVSGSWKAPFLQITNLYTEMYQGHFRASTSIDVATRRAQLSSESDFDALRAYPLLPKSARDWLDKQKFSYEKPPIIHIAAGATLPEWTNHHPDWKKTVVPTLGVLGDFQIGQGSYRGIQFHSASSHITYTNQTWSLPDLYAERPDGSVRMAFESREDTLDYHFKIDSNVDVKAVHPALDPKTLNVLQRFQWDQPPRLEADLWGRWRAPERIGFQGKITTTNLAYKGEQTTFLTADLAYTNRYLVITRARVERTNQWATADSFGLDLKSMVGHLTNGNGVLDHMVVGRLIGPVTAQSLSPYHFLTPPKVHVEGEVPLSEDISVADLRFNIEGNGFAWWKFHVPSIAGNAHWRGHQQIRGRSFRACSRE